METLVKGLLKSPKFSSYLEELNNNLTQICNKKLEVEKQECINKKSPVTLTGLTDVAKAYFTYATTWHTKEPIFLVTYNEIQARKLVKDIETFTKNVIFIPKKEIVTYDYIAESKDLPYERIEALNKMQESTASIVVTTIEALMQPIIPKEVLYKSILHFKVGQSYDIEELKQTLVNIGYERTELIEGRGQFSVRGGILDVSTSQNKGIRIEFWGDEIDSIRRFNISSQRSTEMLEQIVIYPAHEYIIEKNLEQVCKDIKEEMNEDNFQEQVEQDIEQIQAGNYISKIDKYFSNFYTKKSNLLEFVNEKYYIFLDEMSKIKARAENIKKDNENVQRMLIEKEKVVPNVMEEFFDYEELEIAINKKQTVQLEKQDASNGIHFDFREVNYYKSSMEIFIEETQQAINQNKTVIVLAGDKDNSQKLSLLLLDKEIPHKFVENFKENEIEKGKIIVTTGALSTGFECYDLNLLIISSEELFNKNSRRKKKIPSAFNQGEKVVFADLKQGDYIVHKSHGIGQFAGVNTISSQGITKDYIKIKYQDDDILYVPTNQLDNVRKYIGSGENGPKLNRLGSKEWANTKNKVKKNLQEVAKNLIELYAKRQKAKGYAYSEDTPWQKQFEDSFPYVETDDQLRCIEEVKKDMERDLPMDRLLCGDVGYGKTEVAIRAAFKACMDQKQVAYLVPTTVLANQQYEGFKERMDQFAIKVELLNRFKTKKEQDLIIKKLKLGEVDVVIGTHRLLSKDVEFKDLGLLIIDEEHRFGVKSKEKIKEYKTNVDVLTMTATPIPRTLHMSIVGVRDMSVIYEPPQNRKPVQTYVLEYDMEVVKEAITKELERNGQVFYLFNNVEGIERKAEEVARLVPEAHVAFAHGKMTGKELENIMLDFIDGKIDVLVCTTILESGIDIPNANTIVVENADRLGLAQLYQIRGRVGRSNTQSYAYITYKRDKLLSEVADKRLKAIKEFTEFGSGFKIAMRDLEIRGAGSLLGEIQHGHMEQVGYDTYCSLLEQVVKQMQGIEVREEIDVQIDIRISSYISDEYISNSSQKIEMYQDIALCKTEGDIQNVIDEMIDRFGPMPEEVNNLLEVARIKELCKKAGIIKVAQKQQNVVFNFDEKIFNMQLVDKLVKLYKNEIKFSPGKEPYITYKITENADAVIIKKIKEFLKNAGNNE